MFKIYENIKQRRMLLGISQTELAEKMGYADKGMISRIENGKIDLSYSKIIKCAEILKTTPEELMGWSKDEKIDVASFSKKDKELLKLSANCDEAHYQSAVLLLKDGQLPSEPLD